MIKILIVEDEEIIRKGLVYSIEWMEHGCSIAGEASNGAAGLELIKKLSPDVVITDIKMPIMDGLEMLSRARGLCGFTGIILTSYGEFEYAQRAIKLGVSDYILKPIDEDKLLGAVLKAKETIEKRAPLPAAAPALSDELLSAASKDRYTDRAVRMIKERYTEKLSLEKIAEELDVSPSYLSRRFKENMGHTFVDLLKMYRVQKAAAILCETGARACEAADRTGFTDYKYFCSVFKKHTGLAPTEFAKRWKRYE